ncbi:MAG: tetratricopeptide repeat protein [Thermomicrobiales bacterium]
MEGWDWIRRALAHDDGTDPFARAVAYYKLGILEHALGGPDADVHIRQGMELRKEAGDRVGMARGLMNLGNVFKDQGRLDEAISMLEEAAAILDACGDIGGLATTRMYLGMAALEQGDLPRAQTLLTDALALHNHDGFAFGVATTLLALGRIEAKRGSMTGAARCYAESLRLWIDVKNGEGLIDAMRATATLAVTCHLPEPATRLFGVASAMGDALGYVPPPAARKRLDVAGFAARAALGQPAYEDAWESGRAWHATQAAAEAMAVVEMVGSSTGAALVGPAPGAVFTPREHDVLRLLVEGRSDREIAQALGIGYRTVTSYVRNILGKLEVTSRTAAATQAIRRGFV